MSFKSEIIRERRYWNVTCDWCAVALKPMCPVNDDGSWMGLNPDDALIVRLEGGYGMLIDPCGSSDDDGLTLMFCKQCAIKLCRGCLPIARAVVHEAPSLVAEIEKKNDGSH